jgi:hypothetical protein
MKNVNYLTVTLLLSLATLTTYGQGSEVYKGIKVNINESGSQYIRFITWNQMWMRFTENNPGTVDVNGEPADNSFDIGIRRSRFLAFSQITPRFLVLTHFGINNQTFINGGVGEQVSSGNTAAKKPQLFLHDLWTEYALVLPTDPMTGEKNNFSLSFGAGLHYWHGVSRLTNASTLNFMMIDAPIFNWNNIELTDQFARQMGLYVKGKAGKLDYRFFLNKPFSFGPVASADTLEDITAPNGEARAINVATNNLSYGGYVEYEFLDTESNLLPYKVGSYLGTKRVFNLGAGVYAHPDASGVSLTNGTFERQNHLAIGLDTFLDMPFSNGTALTVYAVNYIYDYGDNYLRNIGIMNTNGAGNTGLDNRAQSGFGNRQVFMGTGNVFYTQMGFLLPGEGGKGRFQPIAALTLKSMDALQDSGVNFDVGLNYYIEGHNAKITLQYANRPLYDLEGVSNGSAGEVIVQTQIYL